MPKSFALCRQSVFITMMINHPWLGTLIAITTVTVKYITWPLRYWGCHEGGEHKLKKGVRLKTSPWRYEIVFNGSAVINFSFLISHCLNDSTARIQVLTWVKCIVSYFKDSPLQIHGNLETFKTKPRVTKPRVHTIPSNIKHFSSSKLSSSSLFFCFLSVSLCTHLRTANLADTKLGGAGAGAS